MTAKVQWIDPERVVGHAPLNAEQRLDAALQVLAGFAHEAARQSPLKSVRRFGCHDVTDPGGLVDPQPSDHRAAVAVDGLREFLTGVTDLAREYERIGVWLGLEVARGWRFAGAAGTPLGGTPLSDHHRIITRD